MRSLVRKVLAILGLAFVLAAPAAADKGGVVRFATLPANGPGFPEGLAADARGNIYVATFDFGADRNVVYVFGINGRVSGVIPLPAGAVPLGLAFDADGALWVADFAGGSLLRYAGSSLDEVFPICAGAGCGLNAIAFDADGRVYVSDSFGGNIYRLDPTTGTSATFFSSALLLPNGFPPFGANGLAFDAAGANLYIANTSTDRVLKLGIAPNGSPTALTIFAENIDGADGIVFDARGRLWVAANQADEIVALDGSGQVVDRVGSFDGILPGGSVKGLLFPASLAISRGSLYVTNLALPLTGTGEPEADVSTYTVSRIPLQRHGQ
jgi:sugar lactone lactonase YvrE